MVGQQGRRGILPSAPGYKTATRKEEFVPEKGDDGKYACPHCTKRYLHAKHLKRHYFRRKYRGVDWFRLLRALSNDG